jgi:hypothetical protein
MSRLDYISALQATTKSLQQAGKMKEGVSFNCIIENKIDRGFKRYFITLTDEEGKSYKTIALPNKDENGVPIPPEGATSAEVIQVVIAPLDNQGNEGDSISAWVLKDSFRGCPPDIDPAGMRARATSIRTVHKYGDNVGDPAYFISGITVLADNLAILNYVSSKNGGALLTR